MLFKLYLFCFLAGGDCQKKCIECLVVSKMFLSSPHSPRTNISTSIYVIECCEQYWTSPGGNTPQDTKYTATYLPSRKLSKLDKPDMQDTTGEAGTSS